MSALVTAMLAYTAAPCVLPAPRGPCSGSVMPHAAAACLQRGTLLGRRRRRTLAGVAPGTLRERHTLVGQTLLLRIGEAGMQPARTAESRTMATGSRGRQAARFRRLAERGALVVGGGAGR